jgi:hypothetical protein
MRATVRAFLEQVIDYAGMFPPARLPLRDALRHYTRLTADPAAWLLARFVCPAAQLGELLTAARADGAAAPLPVAVLGRGGRGLKEFADNLDADLRAIDAFRQEEGIPRTADVIELPLPPGLPAREIGDLADYVLARLAVSGVRAFLEVPLTPTWQKDVAALSETLSRAPVDPATGMPPAGLKIRCGGATPAAIPTPEQFALLIALGRERRLPWKATAGLHHPLRHHDAALNTAVHGFFNVFAAGILARVHRLDEPGLVRVLCEESRTAFRFTAERFSWGEWSCTVSQIRDARRWLPSFGSCSFDEPRDDLRAMGLIG